MAVDPTKIRRTNYDVTWDSSDLGSVNDVDPQLKLLVGKVETGSTGQMKLDDRVLGLEDAAKVIIQLRECTRDRLEKLVPWSTGSGDYELSLTPVIGTLLSATYAKALILHPRDMADVSEDIELYKTVPMNAIGPKRTGREDDIWTIEFWIYPDLTKLTTSPYGRVKAKPA